MALIDVNDCTLEVLHLAAPEGKADAAPRAPLVFLHEGLCSVAMWRYLPTRLCAATAREGWVFSRRGYGHSEPVPDVRGPARLDARGRRIGRLQPDYMHHEAWDVLPALLQALGLARPPVLVGHSDGGTIALLHASRHPVAACVVMAPHVKVEAVSLRSIEAAREAFVHGDLRARLSRFHADVDGAFWQWNDAWLNPAFHGFDIREDCARITAPLLAIQGEDDAYGTLAQIDDIAERAPHTQRLVLPGCGHSPHRDAAEAVTAAIAAFLAPIA